MAKRRWKRIMDLPQNEEQELQQLADKTPGMTYYGNRARTAVMLPLQLAKRIAAIAQEKDLTIGQVIVDLLEEYDD